MNFIKILLFLLIPLFLSCQTIRLDTICKMPSQIEETSGLYHRAPNSFWSFNDSGGEPKLYEFDSLGFVKKTVFIKNATNTDWEEIAYEPSQKMLYIGDFGNNGNNRKDLTIYKVPFGDISDTISAEKIVFKYENQTAFPPPDSALHFDAEAMIVSADSIYIFTKDFYAQPYSGVTYIYTLPTSPGQYWAKLSGIFKTDNSWKYDGAITAAAASGDGKIALMSYQKLWVWTGQGNFKNFWINPFKQYSFGLSRFAQREGLAFDKNNNCILYVTSEKTSILGGNLTRFNICKLLSKTDDRRSNNTRLRSFPTPSVTDVTIENPAGFDAKDYLKIHDVHGQMIAEKQIDNIGDKILVENSLFPSSGVYFYTLFQEDHQPIGNGKIIILK